MRPIITVLFPDSSAVSFYIKVEAPSGTPIKTTSTLIESIETEILNLPPSELMSLTTRVGMTGDNYFLTEQGNVGIIFVDLVPFTGRERSAREIMNSIKEKTKNTPGFDRVTYIVESGGPPVGKAISIRIVSTNDTDRKKSANDIETYLKDIPGVQSIDRSDVSPTSEFNLNLNYEAIAELSIPISNIYTTIRTAFNGSVASSIRFGNKDIDFMIQLSESDRQSLDSLMRLSVPNQLGQLIPIRHIATIEKAIGQATIMHYNGLRTTLISGDIDSSKITSTEVTQLVQSQFKNNLPASVQLDFGGESEETNESVINLIISFVLAIIGIFFILVLLFNSIIQPFIVLLTIPFGLIGVIISFAVHGNDLGFISMIGTIGLTGVIVNDSLLLVNHLNNLLKKKPDSDSIIQVVASGAGDRFRPILITSCTTVAGLLPLAYGIGGSDPFIAPMALAIGYGLLFSTPLTLFLLPALFLVVEDVKLILGRVTKYTLKKVTPNSIGNRIQSSE